MWQHLSSYLRHPVTTKKNSRVMQNITYGMIPTFGDYAVTKCIPDAEINQSSSSATQHLAVAIIDQLRLLGKC
ncbi:hypothetical protein CR513_20648, partial [Mucuna pruriens]